MRLLIIIPAYNEAENLEKLIPDLIENYPQYNYIIINDGSTDNTEDLCKRNMFNAIHLPINLGLAGAFQTGMRYAWNYGYDYAIQFDGDGQHMPEYIKNFLELQRKTNADIIMGSRYMGTEKAKGVKALGGAVIRQAIKITTGKKITDPTSGMRMYNRKVMQEFSMKMNFGPEPDTISYLIRCGYNVEEVPVVMRERMAGTSYLNFKNIILYMVRMGFSILFVQWFRRA